MMNSCIGTLPIMQEFCQRETGYLQLEFQIKINDSIYDLCVNQNGCWVSNLPKDRYGYVRVYNSGIKVGLHRLMYQHKKGVIGRNKVIRHICNNPQCVNPEHLIQGTHKQNMEDKKMFNRCGNHHRINENEKTSLINDLKHKNYFTLNDLTSKYNLSLSTIKNMKRGLSHG